MVGDLWMMNIVEEWGCEANILHTIAKRGHDLWRRLPRALDWNQQKNLIFPERNGQR
ncbi:hypothetical protein BMYO_1287 [Bifidobacterium myosotis]|uniref:Uncharacterized protein n=1 Tax=Bifidobacterium myosotis TaxID=1630166 RepID=A0A261FKN8_9BIFI|nr:hypothetical protein BMYO_1287 [Bifidobacterium myosotis]